VATSWELYDTPVWAELAGQARVRVGAGPVVVVMLQFLVAAPDAESRTLAAKELEPPVVGTPVIAPVETFRLKPAGSDPVIENA
jgi:hypothetical protein